MNVSITKLYDLLSKKLGKESAEDLTTFIEEKIKVKMESKLSNLATKTDLAESRSELLKWMFIFWASQMLGTFAFILLFIKK
jgi:hypothetical protein